MFYQDPEIVHSIQQDIEFIGTFAFTVSDIRHAAAKNFDWSGGFVCDIAVAIGGETIRDIMIGVAPFWMTSSIYIICTILAQLFVIVFSKSLKRLDNTWFVFDTLGLALFIIAGIQKSLAYDFPSWVAIIMGCMTGSTEDVIRDVLFNNVPIIPQKEIYAMASIIGGIVYWALTNSDVNVSITVVSSFLVVCVVRFLAIRYHLSLPRLRLEE